MKMLTRNISPGSLGDIKYDGLREDHEIYWDIIFFVDQVVRREMQNMSLALATNIEYEVLV
jgi:hypothetical protein